MVEENQIGIEKDEKYMRNRNQNVRGLRYHYNPPVFRWPEYFFFGLVAVYLVATYRWVSQFDIARRPPKVPNLDLEAEKSEEHKCPPQPYLPKIYEDFYKKS